MTDKRKPSLTKNIIDGLLYVHAFADSNRAEMHRQSGTNPKLVDGAIDWLGRMIAWYRSEEEMERLAEETP